MFRIPLPFKDAALLVIPRGGELGTVVQVTLLALMALVPMLLVLWLYRSELRLVRRSAALGLLTLRLVVIVLLWCVVGLQPIVAHFRTEELPGRVLVAVDRSNSMVVADPQRSPLEKLRLARALKLRATGDRPTDAELDAWIRHYEAKGVRTEPAWAEVDEKHGEPDQRLARERQALHDKICARVDQLTRGDVERGLLAAEGGGFLQALAASHKVELIGFHQDAWDVKPEQMEDLFRSSTAPGAVPTQVEDAKRPAGDPPPGAFFTDLRLPLLRALARSGPDQGPILGVVLMTDGQHNWGPLPVAKAIELGERNVPVFPVALGARRPPPDVAVLEMKAPANVFKDVDANVETRIKVTGLPAQEVIVELLKGGKLADPDHKKTIRHDGMDRVYTVRFQVRMDQIGTQTLEVSAQPTNKDFREVNEENNHRAAVVRVARDKARVLLVDGEARWEYHYLASALRRDRSMDANSVVFVQPRVGKISEAELEKSGNPQLTLPASSDGAEKAVDQVDPLLKYDCIILGDVAPEQLPLADRRRLERYVGERGGTLVLLAGKRFMPLVFQDTAGEDDPLVKMVPVRQPRPVSPPNGFAVTLTYEGSLTPYLQMEPEPEKSAARWAALPRHYWGVVGRTKPGAVALAYVAEDQARPVGAAAQRGKDSVENNQALIVRQNYGFGRVLFVGLDSTWRWRFKVGDTYHHRFWGQVARWAASDKLLPGGNRYIRFGSREPVYRPGREIEIIARLAEEIPPLAPGALAGARIYRQNPDGKEVAIALVPLVRAEAQPRVLEGQVRELPPGQYRVELEIPSQSDKLKKLPEPEDETEDKQRRDTFTVLPPDGGEMVDLATNWALLEDLAVRSKGRVIPAESINRLAEWLVGQVVTRERREDEKLWQDAPLVWVTLGLIVLLLTVEWVGRKMAGLP